jgi:hypothetical protein
MNQTPKKTTFEARNAQYQVDPTKLAEIVSAMSSYLFDERMKYEYNGGEQGRFPTWLTGKGKKLAINTQVGIPTGGVQMVSSHDLATLVLNEDGNELLFRIHAHPRLDIDPKKLYSIGELYQIK